MWGSPRGAGEILVSNSFPRVFSKGVSSWGTITMELENADSNALIWKAVYIGTIPCCDHDQLHTWHGWVISLAFNTAVDGTACV